VMSSLERRDMLQALKQVALFDSLTGLCNRRAFYEQGTELLRLAQKGKRTAGVAMLDLDHFKQINDSFGHASGDNALVLFANTLQQAFPDALCGRLGGEEFALVSQLDGATLSARLDALRQQCSTLNYAPGAPALSFSAGICHGQPEDLESMLQQADMQLYQAKRSGRGRTLGATATGHSG